MIKGIKFTTRGVSEIPGTDNYFSMSITAKLMNKFKIGRNRLFLFLREMEVLDEDNLPYQRYMIQGYFKVELKGIKNGKQFKAVTLVSLRGLEFIESLLTKNFIKNGSDEEGGGDSNCSSTEAA